MELILRVVSMLTPSVSLSLFLRFKISPSLFFTYMVELSNCLSNSFTLLSSM